MVFDWPQYIDLAEQLTNNVTNLKIEAACYRSAISRAYYGVFCPARDKVEAKLGRKIDKVDSHKFVIEKFSGSTGRIAIRVAVDLTTLHTSRKLADYDADANAKCNKEAAEKSIKIAKNLLALYKDPNLKIDVS